jgi:hypothetical protein
LHLELFTKSCPFADYLTFFSYFFLSSKSHTARATKTTMAITLGQMGISTPPATTLTPKITRHNWAQANKKRKIAVTSDAGRFMLHLLNKKVGALITASIK